MGFEVLEEFRPITLMRTISVTKTSNRNNIALSDHLHKPKEDDVSCVDDVDECRTPRSAENMLRSAPLVCPPAPSKARAAPASRKLSRPSQRFFEVPEDLTSVFVLLGSPSKKIRTS
ncbi:hypothetical protein PanWU01x14_178710 [Parasponia andersonii]|uniref:Uncharacterized protein n=1 Tax=Parasponia andersonii TaxID=3476 RepID=A0A2P5C712_PARAD|nr:hypothetical protein PanWU01x14_178710 [Parasponia andersonii]